MIENPLQILGITSGSSLKDAKTSFKKLSLKYHPDKNKSPKAADVFKKIAAAYNSIEENPALLTNGIQKPGDSLFVKIHILPEELYFNQFKTITIKKLVRCRFCDGTGATDKILRFCTLCEGTGKIENHYLELLNENNTCSGCDGVGVSPEDICKHCYGKTVLEDMIDEKVAITEDVISSNTAVLKHCGNAGKCQGKNGDLYVKFVRKTGQFFLQNNELFCNYKITPVQYLIGDRLSLKVLDKTISFDSLARSKSQCIEYLGKKIFILYRLVPPTITDEMEVLYREVLKLEKSQ